MSTIEDCNRLLSFLENMCLNKALSTEDMIYASLSSSSREENSQSSLTLPLTTEDLDCSIMSMYIYPIKSCAGFTTLLSISFNICLILL